MQRLEPQNLQVREEARPRERALPGQGKGEGGVQGGVAAGAKRALLPALAPAYAALQAAAEEMQRLLRHLPSALSSYVDTRSELLGASSAPGTRRDRAKGEVRLAQDQSPGAPARGEPAGALPAVHEESGPAWGVGGEDTLHRVRAVSGHLRCQVRGRP